MKKKYFRLLSIVMVLVMLFSVTATSAMAAETDIGKGEQQLQMEALGYETQTLEFATATTEKFSFKTAGGIDSTVEKMVLLNGDEVYNIVEGELENNLVMKANGDIYLDGNLVKITETTPDVAAMAIGNDNIIMPLAQRHEMTTVCPYGSASDYNSFYDSTSKTLEFEKQFIELTQWAFIQIVCAHIANPILSEVVGALLDEVLTQLRSLHPLNDACSMYDAEYVHNTLGFTVTSSMSVIKHQMYFYADTGFTSAILVNGSRYITAYETFTY